MKSAEKMERCFDNMPVNDRSEIPVMLQILTYAATCAGVSQKEIFFDNKKFLNALKKTYDTIGYPDSGYMVCPGDAVFGEAMPAKRPGKELGDNELFQIIETENMQPDEYDILAKEGWTKWYNEYYCRIQNPQFKSNLKLTMRWMKFGMTVNGNCKFLRNLGVEPIIGVGVYPVFDMLSLIRSFDKFIEDLFDDPDRIVAAIKKCTPEIIESTLGTAKRIPVPRIEVFAMRSSASVLSPNLFDEYVFPYLKDMIEAFWKAGYRSVIHADGDWLPMLDRFTQLPKNSCHFEMDGVTDLFKAYDIIGGWHSMRGDVPATMLSFESPDTVSEYCEKLVTELGMKGGFMLGSGCEVPMTAKDENVRRIIQTVR